MCIYLLSFYKQYYIYIYIYIYAPGTKHRYINVMPRIFHKRSQSYTGPLCKEGHRHPHTTLLIASSRGADISVNPEQAGNTSAMIGVTFSGTRSTADYQTNFVTNSSVTSAKLRKASNIKSTMSSGVSKTITAPLGKQIKGAYRKIVKSVRRVSAEAPTTTAGSNSNECRTHDNDNLTELHLSYEDITTDAAADHLFDSNMSSRRPICVIEALETLVNSCDKLLRSTKQLVNVTAASEDKSSNDVETRRVYLMRLVFVGTILFITYIAAVCIAEIQLNWYLSRLTD
ncbi:hypothetical protein SARC_01568 [Sphaeroforma arctica JP610]|uniref:Uncharacterized protein n=1 Tax=Sphaeroforma arctica JP610 TaxID=667725 RepID=A0A0L0GBH3_9EUKA|nr:hypothetical protein SARC_01568 [Sphaeroforma arctica JP610]KNC86246.1 hypothetical protein SARC_01568 [Sphaeroforma arctica JP610]|eukprot:XP_014160148.1 hypothetical protein SARC_01568 [Sphaeroforma arctica JP610]